MDERTKEAVRYLGYGNHAIDARTLALIASSFQELEKAAGRRVIYRIFDVSPEENDTLSIGTLKIQSRNLKRNLKSCEKAYLLGATLGVDIDTMLRRYTLTDMARVVILQACAAAMLEEYLDCCQEILRREQQKEGFYLRPRFSPGYGDFPITHQEQILCMLDAPKKIGLTLTSGNMLTPTKSVTAIIGLSKLNIPCHVQGCESCEKIDCTYRRI